MSAPGVLSTPFIKDPVSRARERVCHLGASILHIIVQSSLCSASPLSSEKCRHLPEIRLPRMSKPTIFNNSVEVCSLHQKLHPFLVQWHIFCGSVLCRAVITINPFANIFIYLHVFLVFIRFPVPVPSKPCPGPRPRNLSVCASLGPRANGIVLPMISWLFSEFGPPARHSLDTLSLHSPFPPAGGSGGLSQLHAPFANCVPLCQTPL